MMSEMKVEASHGDEAGPEARDVELAVPQTLSCTHMMSNGVKHCCEMPEMQVEFACAS
jgi:hypothetical protein